MYKYFFSLIGIFTIFSKATAQLEYGILSSSIEGSYTPITEYKENSIKQVRIYFEDSSKKRTLIEHSYYNSNGFLTFKKLFDYTRLNDSEIITVEKNINNEIIVNCEINKHSILKAGTSPLKDRVSPKPFWEWYRPLLKYVSDSSAFIKVTDIYTYTLDSSLNFTSYVNGKKISSGIRPTKFTIVSPNTAKVILDINRADTSFINDTLIIKTKTKLADSLYTINCKYFFEGRLIREENKTNSKGIWHSGFIIHKYDGQGRIIFDGFYGNDGVLSLYKDKIYRYEKNTTEYTVLEEDYDSNGKIKSTKKYDQENKIIEKTFIFWSQELINRKFKYSYLKNGLLDTEQMWDNDKLVAELSYEYEYVTTYAK